MSHLTDHELALVHDGALRGEKLWRAQQHLERCGVCRDALEAFIAEDVALRATLGRVPGEDYFERFANRVNERLGQAKQAGAKVEKEEVLRSPFGGVWWRTPRAVALAATLTAVVASAGIVMILANRAELPALDSKAQLAKRLDQVAPSADSLSSAPRAVDLPPAAESEAAPPATDTNVVPAPVAVSPEGTRMRKMESSGPAGEPRAAAAPAEERALTSPPPSAPGDAHSPEQMRNLKRRMLGSTEAAKKSAAVPPSPPSASAPGAQFAPAPAAVTAPPPAKAQKTPAPSASDALARQDRDARAELPPRTVCGVVRDAAGHPVAGAMITAEDASGSAKTNRQGRFCIELTGGAHVLQLLCFGFHSGSVQVPADSQGELSVMMERVGVLAGGAPATSGTSSLASGLTSTSESTKQTSSPDLLAGSLGGDDAALRVLPDSLRAAVKSAASAQVEAGKLARAGSYDAVAASWERLLPSATQPRTEIEVRARIAECRYRAWQIGRDHKRSERAVDALTAFIARASNAEQREIAARWIDSIH